MLPRRSSLSGIAVLRVLCRDFSEFPEFCWILGCLLRLLEVHGALVARFGRLERAGHQERGVSSLDAVQW